MMARYEKNERYTKGAKRNLSTNSFLIVEFHELDLKTFSKNAFHFKKTGVEMILFKGVFNLNIFVVKIVFSHLNNVNFPIVVQSIGALLLANF